MESCEKLVESCERLNSIDLFDSVLNSSCEEDTLTQHIQKSQVTLHGECNMPNSEFFERLGGQVKSFSTTNIAFQFQQNDVSQNQIEDLHQQNRANSDSDILFLSHPRPSQQNRDSVISSTSTIDEYPWLQRSVSELSPCLGNDSNCMGISNYDEYDDNDDVFTDSTCTQNNTQTYHNLINGSKCNTKCTSSSSDDQQSLLSAARESVRSGRLTPLLKVELKYLIQARRMSEGKDEMEVSFEPKEGNELSPSEVERVERRRRQNRMAAKRFREKRKSTEDSLLKNIQELQESNNKLVEQAKQLRQEKQVLMEVVADHLLVCPYIGQLPVDVIGGDGVP